MPTSHSATPANATAALTASDLEVAFGSRTLFSGLDLVAGPGDVVALVGPNGAGKSTLMRVLVGDVAPVRGTVRVSPPGATTAWLPQVVPDGPQSLLDLALARTGVGAAARELEAASTALAEGAAGADDRYTVALERWLALGGADLEDRLPGVAARVGLDVDPRRPLGSLSGGQAARACLVALLLGRHDVLLLDEPTNDLDTRGKALVEEFVREHRGPVLLASHDRAFLDAVATSVVALDPHQGTVSHHHGGWSDHVRQRELDRRRAREAWEEYAERRESLEAQARQRREFATRGRRAVAVGGEPDKHQREKFRARADRQAAKAARISRAADRLEVVEQPRKEWQLRYRVRAGAPSADVPVSLDGVTARRGGFTLGPLDLAVHRGDRIWVTGDNGSGKSTLLGLLLGSLAPEHGRRSVGSRLRTGLIDQRRALLDDDRPVSEVLAEQLGSSDRAAVRSLLAKFGLGAGHVDRPSRTLSTGERTRALMALCGAREVNLLVLDEPTNHLDLPAAQELERALADYDGTLVLVSHDTAFVEAVGVSTRWHVAGGRVRVESR